jgi:hypothetical protein
MVACVVALFDLFFPAPKICTVKFSLRSVNHFQRSRIVEKMVLDIDQFRVEKGGNPDKIR